LRIRPRQSRSPPIPKLPGAPLGNPAATSPTERREPPPFASCPAKSAEGNWDEC
jgi:hypothetical protein